MSIPDDDRGDAEGPRECALRERPSAALSGALRLRSRRLHFRYCGRLALLHCQMRVARVAAGSWDAPATTAHMSEERLIKKYANRRLYDASQSRHITLDDIRNLVVAGVRVKVIEDKTQRGHHAADPAAGDRRPGTIRPADPFYAAARSVDPLLRQLAAEFPERIPREERRDFHEPAERSGQRIAADADLLRRFRGGAARQDRRARRRRGRAAAPSARAGTRHPRVHAVLLEHRHSGAADSAGRRRAERRVAPRRAPVSLLAARDAAARLRRCRCISCTAPQVYDRPTIYTIGPDEHLRFLVLQRAALDGCQRMQFAPHIVHCNDWHTALLPMLLKTLYAWDTLVSRDAHGHVDPQHRLPGLVRCVDDVRRRRQRLGPAGAGDARGRRIQLAARRRAQRRRRHDGEPDVRGGDLPRRSAATASTARCARARDGVDRHPQRRRLHASGIPRPTATSSITIRRRICRARRRRSARSSIG